MAQKFPFTMWVYNPVSDFTSEELALWKNCGFTHPMSPSVYYGTSPAELIPFLDAAEKRGMKLIVGVQWLNISDLESLPSFIRTTDGPEAYEKRFREVYEVLKGHPALYGFYSSRCAVGRIWYVPRSDENV